MRGLIFEEIPDSPPERRLFHKEAEETFRIFYKMVEILTLKKSEERARQVSGAAGD